MRALTLLHPWPFCVRFLNKRIENRKRPPDRRLQVGDRFAIHAAVEPVGGAAWKRTFDRACELAIEHAGEMPDPLTCFKPGIVAIATFGGITHEGEGQCNCVRDNWGLHRDSCPALTVDPWFEGPFGWLLQDVLVLPTPIPCKGAQGLWTVPEDVMPDDLTVKDGAIWRDGEVVETPEESDVFKLIGVPWIEPCDRK